MSNAFHKKKKKKPFALVIASACSGDDTSRKESRSNGRSEPARRGSRGIEREREREEQRVWGLTLNLDPEAENAPRMP